MNQFHAGLAKLAAKRKPPEDQQGEQGEGREPATVKMAEKLAHGVLHRELEPTKRSAAGNAVHYTFGGLMGTVYGAAAEALPAARRGAGSAFGTTLWLTADETVVPALGLAPGPLKAPLKSHASALGAHLVYGITAEFVRRAIRAVW